MRSHVRSHMRSHMSFFSRVNKNSTIPAKSIKIKNKGEAIISFICEDSFN